MTTVIKQLLSKLTGNDLVETEKQKVCNPEKCDTVLELKNRISELELEIRQIREESTNTKNAFVFALKLVMSVVQENNELKGTIRKLQSDKFGKSSEKSRYLNKESNTDDGSQSLDNTDYDRKVQDLKSPVDEVGERRKRGGQKGHKGHGRNLPGGLRKEICEHKLPESGCKCPKCGKAYRVIAKFQRTSHEIELLIELLLKQHIEYVYERECNCATGVSELVVAKKPENIIYKSIFSTASWCKMLGLKYLTGIPINRFNELFGGIEQHLKPSTINGGFEKLLEAMRPLYQEIVKYNQSEEHWHADETRWCRMYDVDGKERRLYWIWVFVGKKSVVYILDPTRSAKVPEKHFKNTKKGFLSVDRYGSYNIVSDKLILAYCWYHLRRDFINVGKKFKNLENWALSWLQKIRKIEQLNRARNKLYSQGLDYSEIQNKLAKEVDLFFEDAFHSSENDSLNKSQTKLFKSMLSRKSGYTVFVDYPDIPMHNNVAERQFRHVANARNNYHGSVSNWGGELAAVTWTIFKTALLNGLPPVEYLLAYFESYAKYNGVPPNLVELLPWNFSKSTDPALVNSG